MEQVMLDMIPTGAKAVCHVSQYDIGRTIRFNLRSGGAVYTLSGTETIKVYIKKPDGTTAERNIANTSLTYVDWVTGEGDCDQAGNCECELVITSGTTVIGSKNFTVKIEEDPYNDQGVVTETAGPAVIATFTTNVVELLQEVKCSVNPIQNGTPWIDSNEVNKVPYIKRNVAGTATRIGNHLYDKLIGGSFAFNQNIRNGNFADGTSNWGGTSTMSASNNVLSVTQTGDQYIVAAAYMLQAGHKTLNICDFKSEQGKAFNFNGEINTTAATGEWKTAFAIKARTETRNYYFSMNCIDKVNTTNYQIRNVMVIDLTQMLGSTIADYIYGLEQATAGAGIAFFKALFPNDYYAYNAGELMSVKATAHIMRDASNTVIGNYPLDSNLELRGIPKLVNNKLEYDGDTYESNGNVTRRYGIVDLGSLTWARGSYGTNPERYRFQAQMPEDYKLPTDYSDRREFVTWRFTPSSAPISSLIDEDNTISGYDNQRNIYIRCDTYTDATSFKNAMNGVYLVYALATSTTESASPFTNPQVCDENGTEEYTDNRAVAIPVGHETYQANICEITGFDELNVVRTGANIWDEETESGSINSSGQNTSSSTQIRTKNYIPVKGNTTYYLKTPKNVGLFYFDYSKALISSALGTANTTFTTPSNCCFVRWYFIPDYGTTYNHDTSILYPSSDHDYHSYSGKLIKLEFDDTVYLAEVSCLNGVWKLKLLGAEAVLPEITEFSTSSGHKYSVYRPTGINNAASVSNDILSSLLPPRTVLGDYFGYYHIGTNVVICVPDNYTVAEYNAVIAGSKLVYQRATPIEITLDETEQFEALLGVNNVWHDGNGNTEVKYLYNA